MRKSIKHLFGLTLGVSLALGLISSAPECDRLAESVPDSGGVYVVPAFTAVLLSLPWIFFFTLVYPILHCCRDQAKRGALCVK